MTERTTIGNSDETLHERIDKYYIEDDSRKKEYGADHPMAGWYICTRCGKSGIRYNPEYGRVARNLISHEYECADDLDQPR